MVPTWYKMINLTGGSLMGQPTILTWCVWSKSGLLTRSCRLVSAGSCCSFWRKSSITSLSSWIRSDLITTLLFSWSKRAASRSLCSAALTARWRHLDGVKGLGILNTCLSNRSGSGTHGPSFCHEKQGKKLFKMADSTHVFVVNYTVGITTFDFFVI